MFDAGIIYANPGSSQRENHEAHLKVYYDELKLKKHNFFELNLT